MTPPGRVHGREWLRGRAASTALDMVRRHLCGLPLEPTREEMTGAQATTL